MKFFIIAALCAVAAAAPEGRRLRAEEHWRPAQGRDLSKYQARHATVAEAGGEDIMAKVERVAAEMRASSSNKKDVGQLKATCGVEGPAMDRIVGGQEAAEHAWPWQVALFIDDAWFCGGSIISENYVLTAAHCADGASYFDVMAGAHNVRDSSEPHRVEITSYNGWTHPSWNSNDLSGDLALIELPSPLEFNEYISPVCLPAAGDVLAEGSMVCVTGWGKPSDSAGGISPVLREVCDLPVISNSDCNDVYGIVGPGVVCVDTTGGRGSCNVSYTNYSTKVLTNYPHFLQGDSGGPLIQQQSGAKAPGDLWVQVGIVSFGSSAGCEVGAPAGFTR
jgi:secreted trypsin-like serine protease